MLGDIINKSQQDECFSRLPAGTQTREKTAAAWGVGNHEWSRHACCLGAKRSESPAPPSRDADQREDGSSSREWVTTSGAGMHARFGATRSESPAPDEAVVVLADVADVDACRLGVHPVPGGVHVPQAGVDVID